MRHETRDDGNRFAPAPPSGIEVPRVEWDQFVADHFQWVQGEHVSLIGPTGSGKTTLALAILPMRSYVMVLATKPKDDTLDKLVKDGYRKVKNWKGVVALTRQMNRDRSLRVVMWPPYRSIRDKATQAAALDEAMHEAFIQGGWTVFADELYTLGDLGLNEQLRAYWSQGRALGLSLVAGTQRPAHVDLMAYDQPTHVFFWRDNDERNLKRISGMNGANSKIIKETVSSMARHDTFYVNTRTGAMVITRPPRGK